MTGVQTCALPIYSIGENTDFKEILVKNKKVFSHNNLASLSGKLYENSSSEWQSRYNATIVVPIKSKPDGKKNTVYYGFLTADSLNPKKVDMFSDDYKDPILQIMGHAADAIATWFIRNDVHCKVIDDAKIMREGELVLSEAIRLKITEERSHVA